MRQNASEAETSLTLVSPAVVSPHSPFGLCRVIEHERPSATRTNTKTYLGSFESKKELPIFYKGEQIEKKYIPDLFCYDKIIVELKAVDKLANEHRAQLLNYLRITKCRLGLLVNFGAYPNVSVERFAN